MNGALSGTALGARLPAIRASKTRGQRRKGSVSRFQISALEPAHHGRVTESTPPPPPHVEKTVRVGVARIPSDIYAANKVAPDIAAVSRLGAGEISDPRLLLRRALPFVLPDSHPLARVGARCGELFLQHLDVCNPSRMRLAKGLKEHGSKSQALHGYL